MGILFWRREPSRRVRLMARAGARLFNVARAQYSLRPSNYVGALVTDATFAGSYNRVVGADFTWREQREFVDGVWVNGVGEYRTTQCGVFFKASYLYRF